MATREVTLSLEAEAIALAEEAARRQHLGVVVPRRPPRSRAHRLRPARRDPAMEEALQQALADDADRAAAEERMREAG